MRATRRVGRLRRRSVGRGTHGQGTAGRVAGRILSPEVLPMIDGDCRLQLADGRMGVMTCTKAQPGMSGGTNVQFAGVGPIVGVGEKPPETLAERLSSAPPPRVRQLLEQAAERAGLTLDTWMRPPDPNRPRRTPTKINPRRIRSRFPSHVPGQSLACRGPSSSHGARRTARVGFTSRSRPRRHEAAPRHLRHGCRWRQLPPGRQAPGSGTAPPASPPMARRCCSTPRPKAGTSSATCT